MARRHPFLLRAWQEDFSRVSAYHIHPALSAGGTLDDKAVEYRLTIEHGTVNFFRVINAQGEYAPLEHTVNVAPMSTTVIEIDGSETGDCHYENG